jgi:2-methylcitrate dehydratase PrpD
MRSENLSADAIESIECRLPAAAIPLVCEPREAKVRPKSTYHMKFSEPFTVAMAAIFGRIDMSDFTQQTLIDSRVLALADRVTCTADSSLSARGFPAIVKVSTRSGKTYAREILAQRGGPGNPMSQKDLLAKFEKNAGGLLGPGRTKQLMEQIMRLPETLDVRAMMDLTHE